MGMLQFCILHLLVIAVVYCSSITKQEGIKSTTCNHNGKDYKDGEEWTVRDSFILRCNAKPNGFLYEEVVACVLSDGTHLALDGTQKQEGQNVWTCTKNSKGSGATKEWKMIGTSNGTAKTSPTVTNISPVAQNTFSNPTSAQSSWKGPRCGQQAPGSHWQEKSFELECNANGEAKLVACLPKTEKLHRVTVSDSPQKEGDYLIHCQQHSDGVMSLKWEWTGKTAKQSKRQ